TVRDAVSTPGRGGGGAVGRRSRGHTPSRVGPPRGSLGADRGGQATVGNPGPSRRGGRASTPSRRGGGAPTDREETARQGPDPGGGQPRRQGPEPLYGSRAAYHADQQQGLGLLRQCPSACGWGVSDHLGLRCDRRRERTTAHSGYR